jgi:CheY-like chemotaxis protein
VSNPRILVADDSDTVLQVAGEILAKAGYGVRQVSDGVAALRSIEGDPPDVVLLDLLMPKMTGFDVLREMKKNPSLSGIPVIIMSGVYKESVVGFLRQLGAAGYIDKDNIRGALLERVGQVLAAAPAP